MVIKQRKEYVMIDVEIHGKQVLCNGRPIVRTGGPVLVTPQGAMECRSEPENPHEEEVVFAVASADESKVLTFDKAQRWRIWNIKLSDEHLDSCLADVHELIPDVINGAVSNDSLIVALHYPGFVKVYERRGWNFEYALVSTIALPPESGVISAMQFDQLDQEILTCRLQSRERLILLRKPSATGAHWDWK